MINVNNNPIFMNMKMSVNFDLNQCNVSLVNIDIRMFITYMIETGTSNLCPRNYKI